jgi:DNA-binding LacI/PurR family transcriptional regulator
MNVTLYDISAKAGVSTATVSRVVNGSPLVKEPTREKVMKVIKEMNYHPNPAARSLAGQTTQTLGVVFPDFDSGFFTEVLQGIDEEAALKGYHIMTGFAHGAKDEERLIQHYAASRRVDALVFMNLNIDQKFLLSLEDNLSIPLLLLDRPLPGSGMKCISLNNEAGAYAAMEHLVKTHGLRDISVINGPKDTYDAEERMKGASRAAQDFGISLKGRVYEGAFDEESGFAAVERMLNNGGLPEAIFALNDSMALGALAGLRKNGFRVPDDVAVIGFDDVTSARHMGLTTVNVPMRAMGRLAAKMVLSEVLKDEAEMDSLQVLDLNLVIRSSCGCVST